MNKYTEGILSDIFDLFTQQPDLPSNRSTQLIEDYIDPYTMDDLFDGVVYKLRTGNTGKTTKEAISLFFPDKGESPEFPDTLDPQLIKIYKHKFEDVIINYVTVDALDIINQVQKYLTNQDPNYDISQITGEQYIGSILKQVDSKKYDIIDKINAVYREFKKESQKKTWQKSPEQVKNATASQRNKTNDALNASLNKFIDNVKHNFPELTDEQVLDNLKFLLANDKYILKAVGSMKPGGDK